MAYSLEQLQAYVATVEQKGMAAAARHLGKHVSTLREQVNNLELDTGLTLFERLPKSLKVTAEGEQLYTYAKSLLKESGHFQAKVSSLLEGVPDSLVIGIDASVMSKELDRLIADILDSFPYMSMQVLQGDTIQVRDWLLRGEVDIGFMIGIINVPQHLQYTTAYKFEVTRVLPSNWKLPKDDNQRWLADRLQLSMSFIEDIGFADADVFSHRFLRCNNAQQMLNLIEQGVGWGHLPAFICGAAVERKAVQTFKGAREVFAEWPVDIAWQATKAINPAMQQFIEGALQFEDR
ncbi:LysR family transcriptional regulator [Paraferrimonas haliotis]|uniref:LysR family transcriptional regulator n=1 Tax=Paraferrimonas haliotis TaxID=2013866 RepID=UPI000BA97BD6|nr:LysR family transcriptional regulator [Paraferrimonas haliotis]